MKTADIKVDQTYQGAQRHKDRLFEVVEVSTSKDRAKALEAEGHNFRRVESEKKLTILVRELGWSWGRRGVRLHEDAERKETYWVRPQDISHEVDIDELVREAREHAERKAAAQQRVKSEIAAAESRVARINAHLQERNIKNVQFYVHVNHEGTSLAYDTIGEFTIGNIEALLGL